MEDKFWNEKEVVNSFANRPCSKYITDEIDKICLQNQISKVIDIGCGGGRYSKYIKEKNLEVFAVDKNSAMVDIVKECGIDVLRCEMSNLKFKNDTFDLVLSIGVLHNAVSLEEYKAAIKEIYRIMKSNAHCIISVFTNSVITDDLKFIGESKYVFQNGRPPMILLSKDTIIEVFKEEGLEVYSIIDEHITNVGTGERNVLSIHFIKR